MKKSLLLYVITGSLLGFLFNANPSVNSSQPAGDNLRTYLAENWKAPVKKYGTPLRLIIPYLQIDTEIVSVGTDPYGKMDVPDVSKAGWFNQGVKPGEKGSAVLDGHFDTPSGAPAVFYNLAKLAVGNEIIVIDEFGTEYIFAVEKNEAYDFDKVPLNEVFYAKDKIRLNLITCNGFFNQYTHNYSKRTVIYATFLEEKRSDQGFSNVN